MHIRTQASTWTNPTNQLVEFNLRVVQKQRFTATYEQGVEWSCAGDGRACVCWPRAVRYDPEVLIDGQEEEVARAGRLEAVLEAGLELYYRWAS